MRPNQPIMVRTSSKPNDDRVCYNCGKSGHLNTPVCSICKMVGHNSRFCVQRRNKPVRRIYEEDRISQFTEEGSLFNGEVKIKADVPDAILCALSNENATFQSKSNTIKANQSQNKSKTNHSNLEVDNWVSYINGNGRKPRHATPTLISTSRPEKAANKPLVSGEIEGLNTKIFFIRGQK